MNRNLFLAIGAAFVLAAGLAQPARAAENDYRWSVGLNFPGIGAKYSPWENLALELRLQGEQNVFVLEPRFYRYFLSAYGIRVFAGLAGDVVSFTGEVSRGQGWGGEVFAGGEYFFLPAFALQIDLGPAWIYLRDQSTGIVAGGSPEWVLNLGLSWYFGKE